MGNYQAIITCLGNAAAAGINSDITQLNGLTSPIVPAVGGTNVFYATANTGGTASAQTATVIPNGFAYNAGWSIMVPIGVTTVQGMTINVNGLGAKNVLKITGVGLAPISPGDFVAGQYALMTYDGTQFEAKVHQEQGGVSGSCSIASAATTDIASVGCHNLNVSGTASITNLGNTLVGNTQAPRYVLRLNGATLVNNSANCATVGGCIFAPGAVNFPTSTNGENVIVQYFGQGSNGGTSAGNWFVESAGRVTEGIPRFENVLVFSSTGTYTPSAGLLFARVSCIAGGAGGGNAASTGGGQASVGAGGTGGAYFTGVFSAGTIGASQTVTIGAGGTATNGGGNTTFGALATANGGVAGASLAATASAGGVTPPSGPSASGGTINLNGTPGGGGFVLAGGVLAFSGQGGSGWNGQGGGASALVGTGANGLNGNTPGSGASGAANTVSQGAHTGGTGANGLCVIEEYLN